MKKRLDEIFRRFFAPDDGGGNGGGEGSGGGGNGEGADGGENGAGDGQGNAGENGDGAGKGGGDGSGQGGGEGGEGEGSDEGGESLLAGDEGAGGGEGDEGDAKPPTPEEVIKFSEAIKVKGPDGKDIDVDDVDKEAIAAISPVLMKHKMTPESASELVGVYAAYALGEQVKAQKAHMDQLKTIREATQKEFGEDLPRIAKEANAGGKAIFGKFWQILRGIPEFCNQPDVIRGLAAHGRSISNDQGAGGDGGGDDGKDKGFSADDWIKHSNERGRSTAGE